jgi:methylthioxylose transferase
VSYPRPPEERSRPRAAYAATTLLLLGFVAVSFFVPWSRVHFPADLPPLFLNWRPAIGPGVVAPLVLGVAFVVSIPWVMRLPLALFLALLMIAVWLLAGSLAMQSGQIRTFAGCCLPGTGTALLTAPFERHGEYMAAVPIVDELGPRAFAERFDELNRLGLAFLPLHVTTHPPGAPIFLWLINRVTGGGVLSVVLIVMLIGALGVVPTYLSATELYDDRTARIAAVLFASTPGVLVYTATSMDVVFMTALVASFAAVVRAPRSTAWAFGAGAAAALTSTLSWAAMALGPLGVGVGLLALRDGVPWRRVVVRGVVALVSFAACVVVIRLSTGIDLLGAYGSTMDRHTAYLTYRRSYPYWLVGNVAALLITSGFATAAHVVARTSERWRARRPGIETVVLATIALSSVLGVFRGETDHNWLFFVPLLVVSAAPAVADVRPVAAAGTVQAAATEILFYTGW